MKKFRASLNLPETGPLSYEIMQDLALNWKISINATDFTGCTQARVGVYRTGLDMLHAVVGFPIEYSCPTRASKIRPPIPHNLFPKEYDPITEETDYAYLPG